MNVYEFNINNVKSPNLSDPIGFHIQISESEETRKKAADIDEVKRSVSLFVIFYYRKLQKFQMVNLNNYFFQFFLFIW